MRTLLLLMVLVAAGGCSGQEGGIQTEVSASEVELGQMNRDFAAALNAMDALSSGTLGYETGSFVLTADGPDGEAVIDRGRYVELLRRQSDGRWLSTHGIWNAPE